MSKKSNSPSARRLLKAIAELDRKLSKIFIKLDEIYTPEDISINLDDESYIVISEELYVELCDEIGEDFLRFMGVS